MVDDTAAAAASACCEACSKSRIAANEQKKLPTAAWLEMGMRLGQLYFEVVPQHGGVVRDVPPRTWAH